MKTGLGLLFVGAIVVTGCGQNSEQLGSTQLAAFEALPVQTPPQEKPTTPSAPSPARTTFSEPAASAPPNVPPQAKPRTWTDISGRHKTEATLLEVKDGNVRLQKTDGNIITVAIDKCSEADQAFVKNWSRRSGSGASSDEGLQPIPQSFSDQLVDRLAAEYLVEYQWGNLAQKLSATSIEAIAAVNELSFEERLAWAMVCLDVPLWNSEEFAARTEKIVTDKMKLEIVESHVESVKQLLETTIGAKTDLVTALNKDPAFVLKWNQHLTRLLSRDLTPEAARAIVRVAAIMKSSSTNELVQARERIKTFVREAIAKDPNVLKAYTEAEDLRKRAETPELQRERTRVKLLMEDCRKKRGIQ